MFSFLKDLGGALDYIIVYFVYYLKQEVCQWLAKGQWFSPNTPVSPINKTDRHDRTEILLKVKFNTIKDHNLKIRQTLFLNQN